MTIEKEKITGSAAKSGKNRLRRVINLTMASLILASGSVSAQLQDHGPGDVNVRFPLWYRDNNNLPLGMCKSLANLGNGPLCFPLIPETVPSSFANNLGPEIFYMNLNVNVLSGAINLRYIAALEAAYGTVNPVGAARLGNELLFSRIRFLMHVNDPNCAGDYQIVHPFGSEPFPDTPAGKRALFATIDHPLGLIGDFDTALSGNIGPFLEWDNGAGVPLPHLVAPNGDQFIGDPNVQHTFTGSPFGTDYVEVQYNGPNAVGAGPGQCNLDGLGGGTIRVTTGALMGQVWTANIPVTTTITDAVFQRTAAGASILDVTATTAPGNNLVVSGNGMPGAVMTEDKTAAGSGTKNYHAQIEVNGQIPKIVNVTNITSNPNLTISKEVRDLIEITKNEYDPVIHTICVYAHSLDQTPVPDDARLVLTTVPGIADPIPFSSTPCPASFGPPPADPRDQIASVVLPNGAPQVTSGPIKITVQSNHGGLYNQDVKPLGGAADNAVNSPVANDDTTNAPTGVSTNINVATNDSTAGTATIILTQPASGAVSSAAPGQVTYTPAADTPAGNQNFTYMIVDGTKVSNVAKVDVNVTFVAQPPITSPDNFAVRAGGAAFTVDVLANDKPAANTTINTGSIVITTPPARGAAVVSAGKIVYTPGAASGTDTFFYTVSSEGGPSAPTRVDVSLPAGVENISFIKNVYKSQGGAWTLTLQENSPGWFGGAMTPTISCYLMARNGVNLATPLYIGSALVSAVNAQAAITTTAGGAVTLPDGTQGVVPVGNATKGGQYTVQCASTNHVSSYPSFAAGGTDRPTQAVGAN